jgi:hypothetical protein
MILIRDVADLTPAQLAVKVLPVELGGPARQRRIAVLPGAFPLFLDAPTELLEDRRQLGVGNAGARISSTAASTRRGDRPLAVPLRTIRRGGLAFSASVMPTSYHRAPPNKRIPFLSASSCYTSPCSNP